MAPSTSSRGGSRAHHLRSGQGEELIEAIQQQPTIGNETPRADRELVPFFTATSADEALPAHVSGDLRPPSSQYAFLPFTPSLRSTLGNSGSPILRASLPTVFRRKRKDQSNSNASSASSRRNTTAMHTSSATAAVQVYGSSSEPEEQRQQQQQQQQHYRKGRSRSARTKRGNKAVKEAANAKSKESEQLHQAEHAGVNARKVTDGGPAKSEGEELFAGGLYETSPQPSSLPMPEFAQEAGNSETAPSLSTNRAMHRIFHHAETELSPTQTHVLRTSVGAGESQQAASNPSPGAQAEQRLTDMPLLTPEKALALASDDQNATDTSPQHSHIEPVLQQATSGVRQALRMQAAA